MNSPNDSPSIQSQKDFYDNRWLESSPSRLTGIKLERASTIVLEISKLKHQDPKILDLGCGTGAFANFISSCGSVTGVELSPEAVKRASQLYPHISFHSGDAFEVMVNQAAFDIVILQEVIEHVDDQAGLIEKCADALRPGGHLILTTPNKWVANASGVMKRAGEKGLLQPIENLLSIKELRHLLKERFEVEKTYTVIPAGKTGLLRIINSHRLNRIGIWNRNAMSIFKAGLHIVSVARRR